MVGFDIVSVTADHAMIAIDAFRRFGKGRHRAALNIGDCFSYALAWATGERLLFKGREFAQTDIRAAILPQGLQ
jgi:ribonuclease VapC